MDWVKRNSGNGHDDSEDIAVFQRTDAGPWACFIVIEEKSGQSLSLF